MLLIGAFSPDDSVPVSVEIVEQLEDEMACLCLV